MKKLDKRRAKQYKGGSIRPKERVKLAPSTQLPPSDAPAWAVLPQFRSTIPPETPLSRSAEASRAKRHLQYDTENNDAENSDCSTCSDSDSSCDSDSD